MSASIKARRANQSNEGIGPILFRGEPSGTGGLPRRLPVYALPSPGRGAHGLVATGLVCNALLRCQVVSCTWSRDGESTNASDQCHCE